MAPFLSFFTCSICYVYGLFKIYQFWSFLLLSGGIPSAQGPMVKMSGGTNVQGCTYRSLDMSFQNMAPWHQEDTAGWQLSPWSCSQDAQVTASPLDHRKSISTLRGHRVTERNLNSPQLASSSLHSLPLLAVHASVNLLEKICSFAFLWVFVSEGPHTSLDKRIHMLCSC